MLRIFAFGLAFASLMVGSSGCHYVEMAVALGQGLEDGIKEDDIARAGDDAPFERWRKTNWNENHAHGKEIADFWEDGHMAKASRSVLRELSDAKDSAMRQELVTKFKEIEGGLLNEAWEDVDARIAMNGVGDLRLVWITLAAARDVVAELPLDSELKDLDYRTKCRRKMAQIHLAMANQAQQSPPQMLAAQR